MVFGLVVTAGISSAPRDDMRLTAVFPPWWSQADVFAAAARAGQPIASGGMGFIILVGDSADHAGLSTRLRHEGALVLLDGSAFRPCGAAAISES
jgi:hypothetical protein